MANSLDEALEKYIPKEIKSEIKSLFNNYLTHYRANKDKDDEKSNNIKKQIIEKLEESKVAAPKGKFLLIKRAATKSNKESNGKSQQPKPSGFPTLDEYINKFQRSKKLASDSKLKALEKVLQNDAEGIPQEIGFSVYNYFEHEEEKEKAAKIKKDIQRILKEAGKDLKDKEIDSMLRKIKLKRSKALVSKARYGDFDDSYYYYDRIGGLSNGDYYLYDGSYYDDNLAYLSQSGHGNRADEFGGTSRANRVNDNNYYLWGYYDDDSYGYQDDMDMFEFYDRDRAGRYAGYDYTDYYYNNYGERDRFHASRKRGRNSYHRRKLQETEGFRDYIASLPMILLLVSLMAVICIFAAVSYHRYHKKNESKENDENKMVVIQAKNNQESQV